MGLEFTPEQQQVIKLHDRNILVSAAAGSGKTAVLVERIIQMISSEEQPVDIDRLLVVTFTNAAAAEMRERISHAIEIKLGEQPENLHLQRQSALLHNAQITTIDSFCLFVIRNNFNDIGLDPGFRIADEGELKLMKQDVLGRLLEEKYEEGQEGFLEAVEYFTGGSNDKLLEEYIIKLYEFSMSYPWPEEWVSQRKKDYDITSVIDMEKADWCQYIVTYIKTSLKECAGQLGRARQLSERPGGPYMYGEMLEQEQEMLEKAAEKNSLKELYEVWECIRFGRLPGKKDDSVNVQDREKAKQLRNEVKKQLEDLKINFLSLSPEQAAVRMAKASQPAAALMDLVLQFKEKLDEKKRKENIIDFHDMEHFALNILLKKQEDGSCQASAAALEYRQFFHEILIDEYQDSNLVQELLLQSISGEEEMRFNRFMVGDVKQSIYKFRLARPELFMEKYTCYSKVDSVRQRIDLHKNFRSRPEVLQSVNDLFFQIMGPDLGGVDYDEAAALYPGAVYPDYNQNHTCYLMIGRDKESKLSVREQEAAVIAERIKKLIRDFQVTDKETGALRPVRYQDIVILLRTTSGWAEDFKRVFEKAGVPAYVASRTGYFQAPEVKEILQLLHVIDNPLQDIPMYGVLKSFFGDFNEEEIVRIRSSGKKSGFLYHQMKELALGQPQPEEKKKQELSKRMKEFLHMLSALREKSAYTPIHKLIQEILEETGYLYYVSAKPGGKQRQANVEMLLTRAAAFENTSYYGLFHFLRYVEQLEKYEVDYGEADILDENADVVRIMSIHKSKGLEFPVCFVAGLSKKFNMQDTTGRLIADMDMGVGVDFIDSDLRLQSKTLRKNAIALKLRLDSLGEELRVLYVAMTRAKEKLILTGVVPDCDKIKAELEANDEKPEKVSFSRLSNAGSFMDFILPCLQEAEWVCPEDIICSEIEDIIRITEGRKKLLLSEPDRQLMKKLSEKLKRQYPYSYLSELYVKTTVSELKKAGMERLTEQSIEAAEHDFGGGSRTEPAFNRRLYEEPEVIPYIPSFVREQAGISGTDRGSAYHKIMELLDFKKLYHMIEHDSTNMTLLREIEQQMENMEQTGKISGQWKNAVSMQKLVTFFQSSLAKRMLQAAAKGMLHKEQPFVLGLPASRLGTDFPDTEMILIQGIIDLFFEEDGMLIVADYKTDAVKEEKELIRRYQVQLDYYSEALFRLTGKEVSEKMIYSFALGKEMNL